MFTDNTSDIQLSVLFNIFSCGHIDVCTFWHRFMVKYTLSMKDINVWWPLWQRLLYCRFGIWAILWFLDPWVWQLPTDRHPWTIFLTYQIILIFKLISNILKIIYKYNLKWFEKAGAIICELVLILNWGLLQSKGEEDEPIKGMNSA